MAGAASAAFRPFRWVAATALLLAVCASARAATVRGTLTILEKKGKTGDPSSAIVYLDGLPADASRGAPGPFRIETRDKEFLPAVLPVPVGATVRFPNSDKVQHNVFSVSRGNAFDLGLYGKDVAKEVTFREPGIVRIYCNVHPKMATVVVVCPSSHFSRVRPDGTFEIGGVPPGRYQARAWDPRGGEASQALDVKESGSTTVSFQLDASGFRRETHLDKEGKPYDRGGEEEYRE
jgi:plastocyanin